MIGKLMINGQDAWTTWGVFLENGSYGKLLAGDRMKPYIVNHSRSIDGKMVSMKNPRMEDKDLTLVFCFANRGNLATTLKNFINAIQGGSAPITMAVPELGSTYRLIYEGSVSLEQSQLKIGKLAVKFNEPNPTNR